MSRRGPRHAAPARPRTGLTGGTGTVSLESINYPGPYWRHYAEAVYIAANGGGNTWDNPAGFAADATWYNASPLG